MITLILTRTWEDLIWEMSAWSWKSYLHNTGFVSYQHLHCLQGCHIVLVWFIFPSHLILCLSTPELTILKGLALDYIPSVSMDGLKPVDISRWEAENIPCWVLDTFRIIQTVKPGDPFHSNNGIDFSLSFLHCIKIQKHIH